MLSLLIAAAVAQSAIDRAVRSNDIKMLASDAFEGRGPGTAGEQKTIDIWFAGSRRLRAQLAGENGGWTQAVPMHRHTISDQQQVRIDGGKNCSIDLASEAVLLTRNPGPRVSSRTSRSCSPTWSLRAREGLGRLRREDVKGKLVIVPPTTRLVEGRRAVRRQQDDLLRPPWNKVEEAGRRGAAAVLAVHDEASTEYPWITARNLFKAPASGIPGADHSLAGCRAI